MDHLVLFQTFNKEPEPIELKEYSFMSVCFKLPEIGPRWYSLILCPECNTVIKSTNDLKGETEELTCPDCGKVFTFELNAQEEYPKVKIRPVPQRMMNIVISRDGGFTIPGNDNLRLFLYAFMSWENFVDDKDMPVKLSEGIKEQIFDQSGWRLPSFVQLKSQFLQKKKDEQEKN